MHAACRNPPRREPTALKCIGAPELVARAKRGTPNRFHGKQRDRRRNCSAMPPLCGAAAAVFNERWRSNFIRATDGRSATRAWRKRQ